MSNFHLDQYKVFAHADKLVQLNIAGDVTPVTVYVELTNKCTFACPWCAVPKGKDILGMKEIRSLVYELAQNNIKNVVLTGGAPFLHPNFSEIVGLFNAARLIVGVETTCDISLGSAFTSLAERTAWVKIPIETLDAQKFNDLRKCTGARLQQILLNTKFLKSCRDVIASSCQLIVEVKYCECNAENITEIAEALLSMGMDAMHLVPLNLPDGKVFTRGINRYLFLSEKKWYNNFRVLIPNSLCYANKARDYDKCVAHKLTSYIASDGNVYLCKNYRGVPDYCFGNIAQYSFSDIWDGMLRTDIMRNLQVNKCPINCCGDATNRALQILETPKQIFL